MKSEFVNTNGIRLHYLDYPGNGPTIILSHGITANALCFDLVASKLSPKYHVIVPDLRGRGESDKPATGYSQAEHAADIVGLMDALGLQQAVIGGHSFGGMLAIWFAACYPARASKVIVMDAGLLHPDVTALVTPSMDRLDKTYPSWEAFLQMAKGSAYLQGWWEPALEAYFRADVNFNPDGTVTPRSSRANINECSSKLLEERWLFTFPKVGQPSILLNGPNPYGPPGAPAIQPEEQGRQTARLLPNCQYFKIPGNHITMIFSAGADEVARHITAFVG